jgi:hypothetical protein
VHTLLIELGDDLATKYPRCRRRWRRYMAGMQHSVLMLEVEIVEQGAAARKCLRAHGGTFRCDICLREFGQRVLHGARERGLAPGAVKLTLLLEIDVEWTAQQLQCSSVVANLDAQPMPACAHGECRCTKEGRIVH